MLDTELLVQLRVVFIREAEVSFFDRNVQVRIIPGLRLVECSCCNDPQLFLISDVCKFAAVPELTFQQVIVSVELSLNAEVALDSGHFTQRLNIHRLEGTIV